MKNGSDQGRAARDSARVTGGYGVLLLVAILTLSLSPAALAQSAPMRAIANNRHKKPAPAPPPPLITETSPVPAPPPAPPPVLTPEQMPPRPPEVTWDGKLLSINAENSTLSDILVAVRARTGAEIDIPATTAGERMAARFGPAPAREVLTSLLSGSNYDYIIQASETDEDAVQSVILTARGKGEELAAGTTVAAQGIRRGPGYTASGKRTFEVMPEQANQSPVAQDVASTTEEGEQTGQPAEASGAERASANAQPNSTDPPPQTDSSSNLASSLTSSDSPTVGRGLLPGIDPNAGPPTYEQMVQGMQQLFEQRRQIQMQQNQAQQSRATQPTN